MLNMIEKTMIDSTDIGTNGKWPNYTYHREKMRKSYIDHALVSKNLTHIIKRCTIADDCIGNTSDHQDVSVYVECKWNAAKVVPQMAQRIAWKKMTSDQIYMKYTLPLQDELFTVNQISYRNGECNFKSSK